MPWCWRHVILVYLLVLCVLVLCVLVLVLAASVCLKHLCCSDMDVVAAAGGCAERVAGTGQQSDRRRMDVF